MLFNYIYIYRRTHIHVVDVDTKELIASWLVCITTELPTITKSYDVVFEYDTDNPNLVMNKKIIFKNPWTIDRKFNLVSSNEVIMKPR